MTLIRIEYIKKRTYQKNRILVEDNKYARSTTHLSTSAFI